VFPKSRALYWGQNVEKRPALQAESADGYGGGPKFARIETAVFGRLVGFEKQYPKSLSGGKAAARV